MSTTTRADRPDLTKVLLVTNIPTPYRLPLFDALNRQLAKAGISLTVVYGAPGYQRRKWQVSAGDYDAKHVFLSKEVLATGDQENVRFTFPGLLALVRRERPDLAITNGFSMATTKFWLRNFYNPTPYVIWSGAVSRHGRKISRLRRWQRRMLVRGAAGFVAYGNQAKRYLVDLGAPENQVDIAINTVDAEYYAATNTVDSHEFLFVGELSKRKRVDLILVAAARLAARDRDFTLVVVGDGPEREALESLSAELGLGSIVHFQGYRQKDVVRDHLSRARAFLFPTGFDIWGLVLVEAMAAGVPCLSSVRAGATSDLIEDGNNGFALDFEDTDSVVARLEWVLDHPQEAAAMGRAAAAFIRDKASLEVSAQGFVRTIERILGTPKD